MDKIATSTLQYIKFKKTEPVQISYWGKLTSRVNSLVITMQECGDESEIYNY